jgi:hypothetical protein
MIRQLRWSLPPDEELEARIRATLRRQAEEVTPSQPRWDDLVQGAGAVVVSLPGTTPEPGHLRPSKPRRDRAWARPVLAAAAALTIVLGAAIAAQSRRSDETGTPPEHENSTVAKQIPVGPVIPVPGDSSWQQATATPLPYDGSVASVKAVEDPAVLATQFLEDWGLDPATLREKGLELNVGEPQRSSIPVDQGQVDAAVVWWSVWSPKAKVTTGGLFLRDEDPTPGTDLWTVVGVYTSDNVLPVTGVRRADGAVSFTVSDYLEEPMLVVRVDGKQIFRDQLPTRDPTKVFTIDDPDPGRTITIEVQHLMGRDPVSITAMALAPDMTIEETGTIPRNAGDPSTTTAPATTP